MHAIQNTNIRPYLVGGGRAKLNANIMMKISFLVPKPKEQQKIANTLSTLDNLIEAQNCKTLVMSFSKSLSQ
jgi:type I restriction enzyme S subunit